MKGFIEVRALSTADSLLVNVNRITLVAPSKTPYGDSAEILCPESGVFKTIESYSEVKKRIANALRE